MKKALSLLLVIGLLGGLLSGCGSAPKSNDSNGKQITTLNATVASEPQSIDPALNDAVDGADYIVHMLEGLTTIDSSGKLTKGMASSWDISEDGLTYTFHLRDAKWSDGQQVKAGDFIYAWQRALDPNVASPYANYLYYIKNGEAINTKNADPNTLGAKASDDKTLVVTLEAPCDYFLQLAGFPTYMPLREDMVTKGGDKWTVSADTYVANGPYKFKSWLHNSQLVMVRNHSYWNDKNITGPETINWKFMSNADAVLTAFKSKSVQYADGLPPIEAANLIKSGDVVVRPLLGTYYLDLNNSKAPFNNPKVREAINLVIDRNYIVNNILKAGQKPAANFVPYDIADPSGSNNDFRKDGKDAYSVAPADYNANVAKAQQLLSEAGYPGGKGFPTLQYLTNNATAHMAIAQYLQQAFKVKLGITMSIQQQDWNVFLKTRQDGNYIICRDAWIADYADPMTFLEMFTTGNGNNNAKYSNPAFDALIAQAKAESDNVKRNQLMHQAEEQFLNTDYAVAPLYFYSVSPGIDKNIEGVVNTLTGYVYFFWTTNK